MAMMGRLDDARRRGSGLRAISALLPRDHLLRRVDRLIELDELRAALTYHYSPRGRPSIDPELLIRMADEDTRDLVRAEMATGLYQRSMRPRRAIERLFADAKARRGMARLRLHGLKGAEEEFLIGAAVLNLLLLARSADQRPRRGHTDVVPLPLSITGRVNQKVLAPARYAPVLLHF